MAMKRYRVEFACGCTKVAYGYGLLDGKWLLDAAACSRHKVAALGVTVDACAS